MTLSVAEAAERDASDIADVHLAAMKDNLLLQSQFPSRDSLRWLRDFLARDTVEHTRDISKGVLVARDDESGEIASFVKWLVHRQAEAKPDEDVAWPADCRVQYLDSYGRLTGDVRKGVMGEQPYYHVTFLCTKPSFAGQGAASKLLRQVQERGAAEGLTVVLESTMNAVGFYEKLGFRIAQGLDMMLPAQGSDEPTELYEEKCMTWVSES